MSEAYYDLLARYLAVQERASQLQHRVNTHTANESIRATLSKLDAKKADVANIEKFLRGSNLRVLDDVAIVDLPGDDGGEITCSLDEAVPFMQGRPNEYGNLFNVERPKEPTPREKRAAEIKAMSQDEYMRGRKQPGFFDPKPEPPQE